MSTKWSTLSERLMDVIVENEKKPKGERKTNKEIFKEFAIKNGTTEASTSKYYYTELKPKIENEKETKVEKKDFDSKIEDYLNKTSLTQEKKRYKFGDVVEVTITTIVDFGAFAITDDGVDGLIHISQITGKEYVSIPEDFFFEGERVRAKIVKVEKNGKLGLSTRALGGKRKVNSKFSPLEEILTSTKNNEQMLKEIETEKKEKPVEKKQEPIEKKEEPIVEKIEEPKVAESEIVEKQVQEDAKKRVGVIKSAPSFEQPTATQVSQSEKDQVIQFVKNYAGNSISTKALKDIEGMIAQHGVFKLTLSLIETVRDLDVSSFITEITKERLAGERLRRSSKRENFTDKAFLRKVE